MGAKGKKIEDKDNKEYCTAQKSLSSGYYGNDAAEGRFFLKENLLPSSSQSFSPLCQQLGYKKSTTKLIIKSKY